MTGIAGKRTNWIFGAVAILVIASLIAGCKQDNSETVATIGELKITKNRFLLAFQNANQNPKTASLEEKKTFLNTMIENELKVMDAKREGLDEGEDYKKRLQENLESIAFQKILDDEVFGRFITEENLKVTYEMSGREINARHILISFAEAKTKLNERNKKAAELLADSVYKAAVADPDKFSALAEKFSDDRGSSKNGGSLGYFGWGRMVPKFQEKAFSLTAGEVGSPVETRFGFHIIKVEDVKTKPQEKSYEESREAVLAQLKNEIRNTKRDELIATLNQLTDSLSAAYQVVYHDSIFTMFMKRYKSGASYEEGTKGLTDKDRQRALITFKNGQITVQDILDIFKGMTKLPDLDTEKLKKGMEGMVQRKLFVQVLQERGLESNEEVVEQLKQMSDQFLIKKITQLRMDKSRDLPEDDLHRYYERNQSEYVSPEKVNVKHILVKDEKTAKEVVAALASGKTFDELVTQYSIDMKTKKNGGITGFFRNTQFDEMGKAAFELDKDEISGVIKRKNGQYSIVQLVDRKEESIIPYDQAANRVKNDLLKEKKRFSEIDWMNKLKGSQPIIIYEQALNNLSDIKTGESIGANQ